jgi:probable addiction module antidote protein
MARNIKRSASYQDYLIESLQDPEEAASCLNTTLEGGDIRVFLLALNDVIQAQGGIAKIAAKTCKSRTSLYRTLSKRGNPYLETTKDILAALGLQFKIVTENSSTAN